MYIPRYYRNENMDEIFRFIQENPFAQLITISANLPLITHLPVELEMNNGNHVIKGHVSKGNPQYKTFNEHGTIVFTGPHSYVSSSWYNHVNVPTWNYIAVHVSGTLRQLNDEELYLSLKQLTDRYESNMAHPVTVDGMKEYVLQQMKGIAGFELRIEKIEGKWKLSQNRDETDFKNIIAQLEMINNENEKMIAEEMKRLNRK